MGEATSSEIPVKREHVLQPTKDLLQKKEEHVGKTAEDRVRWLEQLKIEELGTFLKEINAVVRGETQSKGFDGKGVQAGTIGSSVPPDHEDKEPLLEYALREIQNTISTNTLSTKEALRSAAVVLPTVVNKLHLFADGNGRTSRILRLFIRDGYYDQGVDYAITKEGFNRYDATLASPIDVATAIKLREVYKTSRVNISDDLFAKEEPTYVEDMVEELKSNKNLDSKTIKCWEDSINFSETVRLFAKGYRFGSSDDKGNVNVSFRELFSLFGEKPDLQQDFLKIYREVRKERVRILIDALTGKIDLPIKDGEKWLNSINLGRQSKQQSMLTENDVNTAVKLQTAYAEAFSPSPNAA